MKVKILLFIYFSLLCSGHPHILQQNAVLMLHHYNFNFLTFCPLDAKNPLHPKNKQERYPLSLDHFPQSPRDQEDSPCSTTKTNQLNHARIYASVNQNQVVHN